MITIQKATASHVAGISKVCTASYWATYGETYSKAYIEKVIREFYNHDRILDEVTEESSSWGGYFVAIENDEVIGAGGGGMIGDTSGEIFVLYIDPSRRNEGIGSMLLDAITTQQKQYNATEQWVSVQKGNNKGIPFYEARGFQLEHEQAGYGNGGNDAYISLRYCRPL